MLILDFRTSDFDAVSLSSKEMYIILQESHRTSHETNQCPDNYGT
jgi:hypothetical protein